MSEIISLAEKIKSSKSHSAEASSANLYFSIISEPLRFKSEIRFSSVYLTALFLTVKHERNSSLEESRESIAAP